MNKTPIMNICPFCNELHFVDVNMHDYRAWKDGKLAQDAFPYLSPVEREQLISGACPDCQKKFF